MAIVTSPVELSHLDTSRVDDVVRNAIEILTAQESRLYNMLPKTSARDVVHSYLVDSLKTAGANSYAEGADFTNTARTTPTRLTNLVQTITIPMTVSRQQQQVEHYHGRNEFERQLSKGVLEWANDAEFNLLRGTATSGVSGTATTMKGLIQAASKATNHTTHTSTTQWSATILDGISKGQWDAGNGDVSTDIFMDSFTRSVTDGFTQKSNIVVNNGTMTSIVRTVSTYTTAFSTLNVHTHRYIYQSGTDAHCRVFMVNPQKAALAFLQQPTIQRDLARGGDYDPGVVIGKFTVEMHNQDSFYFADGFKTT